MLQKLNIFALSLLLAACSQQPVIDAAMQRYEGSMPANFSGSWERDYARGDDVNAVLAGIYRRQIRTTPDPGYPGAGPRMTMSNGNSSRPDMSSILPLAQLAELITRPEVLTISQDRNRISIARKDDFAMLCEFYDGVAKNTATAYGTEICGWDGAQLVSNLILPDGLQVTHRFTISQDARYLRVVTTVSSKTSRTPFTLNRYYRKFKAPESSFNCIETLSMKRVCSTGELDL